MIEGSFPAGRVDPVGVAPAEVVAQALRCELLEAVAEAAQAFRAAVTAREALLRAHKSGQRVAGSEWDAETAREMRDTALALDAALVAAGATGKAGT